jgi:F-type H+-transporting ATPase subunit gamma
MSGTTESLRRKIDSAQDLKGVVSSMKALAAASVGQYEKAAESLLEYYRAVECGLAACLRAPEPTAFDWRTPARGSRAIGVVVFGSDQGLVGRFNELLAEFVMRELKGLPGKTRRIWAVGERMHGLMADEGLSGVNLLSVPTTVNAITSLVGRILIDVEAARERSDVVEVHIFHNRPLSGAGFTPARKQLLPLDEAWKGELRAVPWPTKSLPQIVAAATPTLQAFIRAYLFVLLFQACAESLASENASRLAAMQRAEKNIEDIVKRLNRRFHRIRQDSIDEELFDVISGYEASSGGRRPQVPPRTEG